MDPLSDVLSLLEPRNYLSAGLDAGGEWSIQFPDQQRGIKCGAIVSGHCWLAVDGVAEPVHLEPGDCFLLPRGWPFRVASDLGLEPTDAGAIFSPARTGSIRSFNGGGDCLLVSSRFALSGDHAGILLRMLPPIVHIRAQPDDSPLRWPVERMMRELRERQPGSFLVVQHLAHMILIEALRLHMADKFGSGVGWLFALTDKHIGAAIGAMHEDPAHGWTLQTLAARAGMSRPIGSFRKAVAAGVAYLPRDRRATGIFPTQSVLDNFAISTLSRDLRLGLLSMGARRRRYETYRQKLSIVAPRPDAPITTLSGGNQQKVLLARALALEPRILLLNDPTRGVDVATRHVLYDVFRGLAAEGMTLIILSSEIEEILLLCHRVLVFREQRLAAEIAGDGMSTDAVIAAMFGRAA